MTQLLLRILTLIFNAVSRVSATAVSGFVIPLCFMTIIIKFIERRSFFSLQFTALLFSVREISNFAFTVLFRFQNNVAPWTSQRCVRAGGPQLPPNICKSSKSKNLKPGRHGMGKNGCTWSKSSGNPNDLKGINWEVFSWLIGGPFKDQEPQNSQLRIRCGWNSPLSIVIFYSN